MDITNKQVVAARGLLGISQNVLSKEAGVSQTALARFESGETEARANIKNALQITLEKLGVEFSNGGVIPKRSNIQNVFGLDSVRKIQDDIWAQLKNKGGEILLYGIDETYSTEEDVKYIKELQKYNISEKILIKEGDKNFIAPKNWYRWIPKSAFQHVVFFVYSDRLAFLLENPIVGNQAIIIENGLIADAYRSQFMYIWEQATIIK